jgi:ribosomal protein L11 methyltransferase
MSLVEIKAELPFEAVDVVDELLLERGDQRWSVFQEVVLRKAWVIGVFEAAEEAELAWGELKPWLPTADDAVVRTLSDADWRDSYKAHFKAWHCGRLHWVPIWERERYPVAKDEVVIWLDPGLAFGTGNHETTRLCCERLVAWAAERPQASRVIDAGCGSGILALSAARLGLREVSGFDNDPEAVRVSQENAAMNGLAGTVKFEVGDLVSGLAGVQADLVLANIQADVLMAFAKQLVAAVAPGGMLALSGILARERDTVRDAFVTTAPDWKVDSRIMGEWCDVALTRPAA